ncbi:MAG: excinuclease ABC subunit UvrA, partial [Cellulomonadaceae bacterium]|nr:excinuclease ABC subunit UvrA [Cellulomonadaceae bacterium]
MPLGDDSSPASLHDAITVRGARVNNLHGIDVDIPKRRLTVFTGVSGSGKTSLVFDTIAAESKRLIDQTYPAFLQGFMPSIPRPDVDRIDGLTPAIIVDQDRLGANPRSTVGTATDAHAMLRVLFSSLGQPHIGPPTAFSFNIPTTTVSGMSSTERGGRTVKEAVRQRVYLGGMCPRCEGRGAVSDLNLAAIIDNSKSLNDGAILVPGYAKDGWMVKQYAESGLFNPDLP